MAFWLRPLGVVVLVLAIANPALAQTGGAGTEPWETAVGQACFERWISEVVVLVNTYDGDDEYNDRKPWSINQYGILEGNAQFGPTSVAAPDNFWRYGNNKHWWMWAHYPVSYSWQWPTAPWRGAEVPPLRPYVLSCIADAGAAGSGTTGGGTIGGGATVGTTVLDPTVSGTSAPPFGGAEPARVSGLTIQAGQRLVVAGDTVWVPVWLIDANDVSNMNFEIGYDVGVVAIEGDPIGGNLLGGRLFTANAADPELARFAFAGTSGLAGTGTAAWVQFRAVGAPGEFTTLTVAVSEVNSTDGTSLGIRLIAGWVQITDENGRVPGDCNNDGRLTEFDAFCALEISVQLRPNIPSLDQDADAQVTSRDATLILQSAVRST
jgi:hypothetical protein